MKYFIALLLLFLLGGCTKEIFRFRGAHSFIADPCSESFTGIYSSRSNRVDTLSLIRIDSNGQMKFLSSLDTILSYFSEYILNDSLLLIQSGMTQKNKITKYDIPTHKMTEFLNIYTIAAINEDRKYIACMKDIPAVRPSDMYQVENGNIIKTEKTSGPYQIRSAFGKQGFLAFKDSIINRRLATSFDHDYESVILRPDMTISDSIPKEFAYDHIRPGKNDQEMVFAYERTPIQSMRKASGVIRYNFDTKQWDTLFSGIYFSSVTAVPNSDYYLLHGLSQQDAEKQIKERIANRRYSPRRDELGWDDMPWQPSGYRMIGNTRTQEVKKLQYKDYEPTISSSGRHILFVERNGNDFQVKVVPLEELWERAREKINAEQK